MRNTLKVILFAIALLAIKASDCNVPIDSLDAPDTPSAIGPYSKVTRVNLGDNDIVFFSGQIGINPKTGDLVSDDVAEQATQLLQNIQKLLEHNGSSLNNVSKTTIFLADMNDFNTVNGIYAKFFTKTLPARSTVAVKSLPKNAKVEIEGIAFGKQECRPGSRTDFLQ